MIADGDDCIKVLTQMKAIRSAMAAVMDQMMVDEFDRCLKSVSAKDKKLLVKVKKYVQSN